MPSSAPQILLFLLQEGDFFLSHSTMNSVDNWQLLFLRAELYCPLPLHSSEAETETTDMIPNAFLF